MTSLFEKNRISNIIRDGGDKIMKPVMFMLMMIMKMKQKALQNSSIDLLLTTRVQDTDNS